MPISALPAYDDNMSSILKQEISMLHSPMTAGMLLLGLVISTTYVLCSGDVLAHIPLFFAH
jgi:hypothetical protein